jgi:hypothetical protein
MRVRTFMSTDWIEVHDHGSVYMAKVFLTDEDNAYMLTVQDGKKNLFKVDSKLLNMGELGFFERVMENAKELDIETAIEMGFMLAGELNE